MTPVDIAFPGLGVFLRKKKKKKAPEKKARFTKVFAADGPHQLRCRTLEGATSAARQSLKPMTAMRRELACTGKEQ